MQIVQIAVHVKITKNIYQKAQENLRFTLAKQNKKFHSQAGKN